ncbi:MAG: penicillin-binding protein 1C [Bacteroidota bacterium]
MEKLKSWIRKYKYFWISFLLIGSVYYLFCLPKSLFQDPTSTVLEDRNGMLLGARIAADGQWRFPAKDSLPNKYITALIEFEDRRFYRHIGIDPIGLARAVRQNIKARAVVSGGSTITMQIIRLARKKEGRTIWNKFIEMIWATRLEWRCSKAEILHLYAAHAPFGGNVVGLEAAAWRYYHKAPTLLSWSEAATLAVLPNAPALIHPGRNRVALQSKRDRLLRRLLEAEKIDTLTYQLALEEPLPKNPLPLPRAAPHLLDRVYLEGKKSQRSCFQTTIDNKIQTQAKQVLQRHHQRLKGNHIYNAAALIAEVETGAILAYVGNVVGAGEEHGEQVDIITAARSTGSVIKPLLYAAMLQEGSIVPSSLISDIPTHLSGYRPENFHERYDGVVTAKRSLVRSLNVPMVRMLQQHGLEKFHFRLQELGLQTINQPPQHYGLPLILGGAEVRLDELTGVYASMARTLHTFSNHSGRYAKNDFRSLHYLKQNTPPPPQFQKQAVQFNAASIWFTFDAMKEVERPNSEGEWKAFQSSSNIAWKTGTSFGFRDAWAVGVNDKYVVGVWVGNADGEGRPGLVGVQTAAPLLFDLFKQLPASKAWFPAPYDEMASFAICAKSGYRALNICPKARLLLPRSASKLAGCPHHQSVHLDDSANWQVHSGCESVDQMKQQAFFVLPPVEEYYYKNNDPSYQKLPPFRADCAQNSSTPIMQLIYPKEHAKIYLPTDLDGVKSKSVFRLAHRAADTKVHWHLDRTYLGSTQDFHELALQANIGKHLLTLVDEKGNRLERSFEVLGGAE